MLNNTLPPVSAGVAVMILIRQRLARKVVRCFRNLASVNAAMTVKSQFGAVMKTLSWQSGTMTSR